MDLLDTNRVFRHRLFREHCVLTSGIYIKVRDYFKLSLMAQDLSRLGRKVDTSIIIDNSPVSYSFHPDHAVPITSWFDDVNDTELLSLLPLLTQLAHNDMLPVSMISN